MKKLLNTLYIQTQGSYLRQEGETVVAERERNVIARIPIHTLSGIVCFGNVLCSPFLLGLCGERGVHVSFLSEHGRFLARVEGPVSGNVLLRVAQMKAAQDADKARVIAAGCVAGKILNARTVLQRRLRDHGDDPSCAQCVIELAGLVQRLRSATTTDEVRGVEGEAAVHYFKTFGRKRSRRPSCIPSLARRSKSGFSPMSRRFFSPATSVATLTPIHRSC